MLTIFKEVLDYGKTKKAVCDARCPSGTDFVCIVPYGPGAAQSMFECVLADLYESVKACHGDPACLAAARAAALACVQGCTSRR